MEKASPVQEMVQCLNRQPIYAPPKQIRSRAMQRFTASVRAAIPFYQQHPDAFGQVCKSADKLIQIAVRRREDIKWHHRFVCISGGCALALLVVTGDRPFTLRGCASALGWGIGIAVYSYSKARVWNRARNDLQKAVVQLTSFGIGFGVLGLLIWRHLPLNLKHCTSLLGNSLWIATFYKAGQAVSLPSPRISLDDRPVMKAQAEWSLVEPHASLMEYDSWLKERKTLKIFAEHEREFISFQTAHMSYESYEEHLTKLNALKSRCLRSKESYELACKQARRLVALSKTNMAPHAERLLDEVSHWAEVYHTRRIWDDRGAGFEDDDRRRRAVDQLIEITTYLESGAEEALKNPNWIKEHNEEIQAKLDLFLAEERKVKRRFERMSSAMDDILSDALSKASRVSGVSISEYDDSALPQKPSLSLPPPE